MRCSLDGRARNRSRWAARSFVEFARNLPYILSHGEFRDEIETCQRIIEAFPTDRRCGGQGGVRGGGAKLCDGPSRFARHRLRYERPAVARSTPRRDRPKHRDAVSCAPTPRRRIAVLPDTAR